MQMYIKISYYLAAKKCFPQESKADHYLFIITIRQKSIR